MGKKFCFGGSRVRHQFSSIDPNKLGLTGVKCSVVLDNLKEGGAWQYFCPYEQYIELLV